MKIRNGVLGLLFGQLAFGTACAGYTLELTQGSFPRSWMIPCTQTSIRIGGAIKADYIVDLDGRVAGNGTKVEKPFYPSLPLNGASDFSDKNIHTRFHVKDTKFFIKTMTPSCYGDVKTYLEMDFYTDANIYGANNNYTDSNQNEELTLNSVSPRLRHAYGRFYKLLMGKTWTNFQDPDATPEVLTKAGLAGRTWVRQTQIRWEDDLGCMSYGISLENPEVDFKIVSGVGGTGGINDVGGTKTGLNKHDKYPDVTAYVKMPLSCDGHIRMNGLLRGLQVKGNLTTPANSDYDDFKLGWGLGFSMRYLGLRGAWSYGHGIGRYIEVLQTQALVCDGTNCQKLYGHGGYISYQHCFPNYVRSNIGYGYAHVNNKDDISPVLPVTSTNKSFSTAFINAIWSPVNMVDMGVEFIWPRRKVEDDTKGDLKRLMFSAKFNF